MKVQEHAVARHEEAVVLDGMEEAERRQKAGRRRRKYDMQDGRNEEDCDGVRE